MGTAETGNPRLYLSPPHLGEAERHLLLEAVASNWIAPLGPHVDAFEREVAGYLGVDHALALSSGTAAIHLALRFLGIGPGDKVGVSTLTFVASAAPITYLGATPVFFDCDAATWNIDPDLLAQELDRRERQGDQLGALVVVDLLGQSADHDRILGVCQAHGVPVVEDAAEAFGATYRGRRVGSFGDAGILSFNGNKIITTSGGGMLVSPDADLIAKARHWSTQARDDAPHYEHSELGYNYRLSNLLAAVGRGQLQVLDQRVDRRREINAAYREILGGVAGVDFMPEAEYGRATFWLTCITVDADTFGADPDTIRLALEEENIEARPVWKPLHRQPVFAGAPVVGGGVAEDLFGRGLCLPSGSSMSDGDVERVAKTLLRCGR